MKRFAVVVLILGSVLAGGARAQLRETDLTGKSRTYVERQAFRKVSLPVCVPDPPTSPCVATSTYTDTCISLVDDTQYVCEGGQWGFIVGFASGGAPFSPGADQQMIFTAGDKMEGAPGALYNKDVDETKLKIVNGVPQMHMFATGGSGTSGSPWTGWEDDALAQLVAGKPVHFPVGYYSTSGFDVTSASEVQYATLTGDGPQKTIIKCTGSDRCFNFDNDFSGRLTVEGMRWYLDSAVTTGRCAYNDTITCTSSANCIDGSTHWGECIKAFLDIGNQTPNCDADHGIACNAPGTLDAECGGADYCRSTNRSNDVTLRNVEVIAKNATVSDGVTAIKITNANHGVIDNVLVSADSDDADWWRGLDLMPCEEYNRGNFVVLQSTFGAIEHNGVRVAFCDANVGGAGSLTGNVVNDVNFVGTKVVGGGYAASPPAGTVGFDLYHHALMTTFSGTHSEAFHKGVQLNEAPDGTKIENMMFGHMASSTNPDGFGVYVQYGVCANVSGKSRQWCATVADCTNGGASCIGRETNNLSVTGSTFAAWSPGSAGGACYYCSNAKDTHCSVDGDCSGGTCEIGCGTALLLPNSGDGHTGITLDGNYYVSVRDPVIADGHCSTTTATECDEDTDCPATEWCKSSSTTSYGNTKLADGPGILRLTRTALNEQTDSMFVLDSLSSSRPGMSFVDNFGTVQNWFVGGDNTAFVVNDSTGTATRAFTILPTSSGTPDHTVGINTTAPSYNFDVTCSTSPCIRANGGNVSADGYVRGSDTVTDFTGTCLSVSAGALGATPDCFGPTQIDETATYGWSGPHTFSNNGVGITVSRTAGSAAIDLKDVDPGGTPGWWRIQTDNSSPVANLVMVGSSTGTAAGSTNTFSLRNDGFLTLSGTQAVLYLTDSDATASPEIRWDDTAGTAQAWSVYGDDTSWRVTDTTTGPTARLTLTKSTGRTTFNPGIVVGGDSIDDFTGTGLAMSGNALTATLGTSVDLASEVTGDLPFSNIAQIATAKLLGRTTAGTGDIETIGLGTGVEFSGNNLQNSAFTGDVSKSAGSNATVVKKASEEFAFTGDISPSQITSNQNDYNPTSLSTSSVLRVTTDASTRQMTGLQGGADGRIVSIQNVGSFDLTLVDDSASSSSANRFDLTNDKILKPSAAATLMYDSTQAKWRLIAGPGNPRVIENWMQVGVQFNSVNSNNWNSLTYLPSATTNSMGGNWPAAFQYNTSADTKYIWSNSWWLPTNWDANAPIDVDLLIRVPQESKQCAGGSNANANCTANGDCNSNVCNQLHQSLWAVKISCIDTTDSYEFGFSGQENTASTQYVSSDSGGYMLRTVSFANLAKSTCGVGELLGIMVRRDGDDVTDTAATVSFHGLKLRYTVIE